MHLVRAANDGEPVLLKNKHRTAIQGENQLKAPGSKLIGKDPIRSTFSFELPVAFMCAFTRTG